MASAFLKILHGTTEVAHRPPGGDIYGEEWGWGIVVRNRGDDTTRGLEIWSASSIFPSEILEAFPASVDVPIESEP